MDIVVVGTGYVGLVAGVCFAEIGHRVTCVDIESRKIDMINSGKSPIYEPNLEELMIKNCKSGKLTATSDYLQAYKEAKIIFIGVGTPDANDGSADLSYLEAALIQIAQCVTKDCLVVIKSTVPVGTNDKAEQLMMKYKTHDVVIEVASNPEFLSQGRALYDMFHASRIVIGTASKKAEELLLSLYEPFHIPIVSVSRRSAEMIKYASNCFLAMKLSYINEIANLCELSGANIEEVTLGMSYDNRIGNHYLNAGIGYGGSCLPKDTKALYHMAREYNYHLKILDAVISVNEEQKTKLIRMAKQNKEDLKCKIAVLGLTFKPNTDDFRKAPSIDNIELLLQEGAQIYAYDPVAEENIKKLYPTEIIYTKTVQEAVTDAKLCFIFTEWKQIKEITPEIYKKLMKKAVIYDGRNIYQPKDMKQYSVTYYSIGRDVNNEGID